MNIIKEVKENAKRIKELQGFHDIKSIDNAETAKENSKGAIVSLVYYQAELADHLHRLNKMEEDIKKMKAYINQWLP